mgnify:CR=1 FL=1
MRVRFTNFPREFKILKKELNKKFNKIGGEGQYILGKELEVFEKRFFYIALLCLNKFLNKFLNKYL